MMGQTDRSEPQVSEHLVMIEVDLRRSNFPEAESVTVLMDASVCSPMRLGELTAVHYAVPIGQVGPAISTTREGYEFVSRRCGTDGPKRGLKVSVYVDDCFCHADDWGKWQAAVTCRPTCWTSYTRWPIGSDSSVRGSSRVLAAPNAITTT